MKILGLHLLAFGSFTDKVIDLSSGNEGLHVIYGPNESGKSTALRALKQALYGIPPKSSDDFVHGYSDMRIGLVLKHSDGSLLKLLRRKGNVKTLRDLNDENKLVPDNALQKYLGSTSAAVFETMFGINHESLIKGGHSIIGGESEVGELLFSAGAGIADLKKIEEKLAKDYEELFAKSAINRSINKALSELSDLKRKLKEAELSTSEWEKHDQELRSAQELKADTDQKLFSLDKQINKLEKIRDALPLIAERTVCQNELQPVKDVVLLPPDFQEISRKLTDDLLAAKRSERQAKEKLGKLENDIKEIQIPEGLLEQSSVIENLVEVRGSHTKAESDRAGLTLDVANKQNKARLCLKELGLSPELEQAESFRLKLQEKSRITELSNQYSGVSQAATTSKNEKEILENRLAELKLQLDSTKVAPHPESLISALKKVEQHGQLEEKRRNEALKLARLSKEFAEKLQSLKHESEEIPDLLLALFAKIQAPSEEVQEHFRREFEQLSTDLKTNRSRIEDCKQELQKYSALLAQSEAEMAVPTEEDLTTARQSREQEWQSIIELLSNKTNNDKQSLRVQTYEKAVNQADSIADRLRREANRVANKANLISQKKERELQLGVLEEQKAELDAAKTFLLGQWQEIWLKSGFKPNNLSEAKAWFREYCDAQKLSVSLKESLHTVEELDLLIQALKFGLGESLKSNLEADLDTNTLTLSALIQKTHERIEHILELRKVRSELERDIKTLSNDSLIAGERAKNNQEIFDSWRKNWAAAMLPLSLPDSTNPGDALSFVNQLDELLRHLEEAKDCQRRIDAIDRDSNQFKADVMELSKRIAPDLINHPAAQAVGELSARLLSAKESRSRLSVIKKQLAEEAAVLETSGKDKERLLDELRLLCNEAKVENPDELITAAQKSETRRHHEAEINTINRQLARLSPDQPLDSFIQDCLTTDSNNAESELALLLQQRSALIELQQNLSISIGREQKTLEDMNGKATAAEVAERIQELQAQIGNHTEQYARLKLASVILKRSIERYRERNQNPILKEASTIFSKLTLGAYAGLSDDLSDNGQAILRGVRPDSRRTVDLQGMSEGTCDQLFLSLRLASLQQFMEKEEAIPLIFDDILVNFDDKRSAATLEVLAELSNKTQIILFTHHAHLLELAKSCISKKQLFIHHLQDEEKQLVLEEALA
ncbi:MAG: AAA family ATPase [Candidatus Obscuribacterales bacterium]|nr:AAA family ATPase [Candidatus Obscuribacterales bacterium]